MRFVALPGTCDKRTAYKKWIKRHNVVFDEHTRGHTNKAQWSMLLVNHYKWWGGNREGPEPRLDDAMNSSPGKDTRCVDLQTTKKKPSTIRTKEAHLKSIFDDAADYRLMSNANPVLFWRDVRPEITPYDFDTFLTKRKIVLTCFYEHLLILRYDPKRNVCFPNSACGSETMTRTANLTVKIRHEYPGGCVGTQLKIPLFSTLSEVTKTFQGKSGFSEFIPNLKEKSVLKHWLQFMKARLKVKTITLFRKSAVGRGIVSDILTLRKIQQTLANCALDPKFMSLPECCMLVHHYRYLHCLSLSRYTMKTKLHQRPSPTKSNIFQHKHGHYYKLESIERDFGILSRDNAVRVKTAGKVIDNILAYTHTTMGLYRKLRYQKKVRGMSTVKLCAKCTICISLRNSRHRVPMVSVMMGQISDIDSAIASKMGKCTRMTSNLTLFWCIQWNQFPGTDLILKMPKQ